MAPLAIGTPTYAKFNDTPINKIKAKKYYPMSRFRSELWVSKDVFVTKVVGLGQKEHG